MELEIALTKMPQKENSTLALNIDNFVKQKENLTLNVDDYIKEKKKLHDIILVQDHKQWPDSPHSMSSESQWPDSPYSTNELIPENNRHPHMAHNPSLIQIELDEYDIKRSQESDNKLDVNELYTDSEQCKTFYKLYCKLFTELTNSMEKRFLCFILLCILCNSLFICIFFMYIGAIIDLLTDSYSINHLTYTVCNIHVYIECNSNESMIHIFIITLIVLSIFASIVKFSQSISSAMIICSMLKRISCLVFDLIINKEHLSVLDGTSKNNLKYLLSSDLKHVNSAMYAIIQIIESFFVIIFCGIYLFLISWHIALCILASFTFLLIVNILYIRYISSMIKLRKAAFKIIVFIYCRNAKLYYY
eukprot:250533_1